MVYMSILSGFCYQEPFGSASFSILIATQATSCTGAKCLNAGPKWTSALQRTPILGTMLIPFVSRPKVSCGEKGHIVRLRFHDDDDVKKCTTIPSFLQQTANVIRSREQPIAA